MKSTKKLSVCILEPKKQKLPLGLVLNQNDSTDQGLFSNYFCEILVYRFLTFRPKTSIHVSVQYNKASYSCRTCQSLTEDAINYNLHATKHND